jgi:hypothetical protein
MDDRSRLVLMQMSTRGGDEYELLFESEDGCSVPVKCGAQESGGSGISSIDPDIFMSHGETARPVVAAVMAFHRARK